MCGIVLTNAAGEGIAELTVEAPFEMMRERCRRAFEETPGAAFARLVSTEDLFEFGYP